MSQFPFPSSGMRCLKTHPRVLLQYLLPRGVAMLWPNLRRDPAETYHHLWRDFGGTTTEERKTLELESVAEGSPADFSRFASCGFFWGAAAAQLVISHLIGVA